MTRYTVKATLPTGKIGHIIKADTAVDARAHMLRAHDDATEIEVASLPESPGAVKIPLKVRRAKA